MNRMIRPLRALLHHTHMLPRSPALIADHRQRGHELLIIIATNRFITAPIAAALGVVNLIACEAEIVDGLRLLELVDSPVAVDPDDTLRARAVLLGWPVISLR